MGVERVGEAEGLHVPRFQDRRDAGQRLGLALRALLERPTVPGTPLPEPIVIALPRGGVLVGAEVARAIGAPLDIWIVRKVGVPGHEELGLGAVAEGGATYISPDIVAATNVSPDEVAALIDRKKVEVERRTLLLRHRRPRPVVTGKRVILVDDGIATGGTIRAVARALRAERPWQLVLAAPIAALDTANALAEEVDEVVCLETPTVLHAVGAWYDDFRQVADGEVVAILEAARDGRGGQGMQGPSNKHSKGRS
jgi:putative phosphoribosyl transferase